MTTASQRVLIFLAVVVGLLTWAAARGGTVGDPFTGTPIQINGAPRSATIFPAVNFDLGGKEVGYHQPLLGNCSSTVDTVQCGCPQATRPTEDVRICSMQAWDAVASPTSYFVTNAQTGLWLQYTIEVAAVGSYTIELNMARGLGCPECANAGYYVELDGKRYPQAGNIPLPQTAGWRVFEWRGKSEPIPMVPGIHRLRIVVNEHFYDLKDIRVTVVGWYEYVPVWKTLQ